MESNITSKKAGIIFVLIVILLAITGSELYILYVVQNLKPNQSNSQSKAKITPILDPLLKKKNLQNLFLNDVKIYIQSPVTDKKRLLSVLRYIGSIKEISFSDANMVNLTIKDKDGKILQSFVDWNATKFTLFKNENKSLIQISLNKLKKGDFVQVQEFEEVIKDSMTVDETKNLINYVEIILQ